MSYLAREASERVARKWQQAVQKTVERIIANPGRGHPRRDLKPEGIRAISVPPFRKHLLFYRWSEADLTLEFYRVRYGAMNLPPMFPPGD